MIFVKKKVDKNLSLFHGRRQRGQGARSPWVLHTRYTTMCFSQALVL